MVGTETWLSLLCMKSLAVGGGSGREDESTAETGSCVFMQTYNRLIGIIKKSRCEGSQETKEHPRETVVRWEQEVGLKDFFLLP